MSNLALAFPHDLGIEEARRRLDSRTDWALQKLRDNKIETETTEWADNARGFRAKALGQTIAGTISVSDDAVRLDASLPLALRAFSPVIQALAKKYAGDLFARRT